MKRSSFVGVSLLSLSLFILVACSSGKTSSSSSSSSYVPSSSQVVASSSVTEASSEITAPQASSDVSTPQVAGMNIQQIVKGDFSSVTGTWKNSEGDTIGFSAKGLTDSPGYSLEVSSSAGGVIQGSFVKPGAPSAPAGYVFIPAGVKAPGGSDASKTTLDRIFLTQNTVAGIPADSVGKMVYYKVSK